MFYEIADVCEHLRGQRSEDVQVFQLQLLIFKLMFSTKNMPTHCSRVLKQFEHVKRQLT